MLPAKNRLTKREDFKTVYENGKFYVANGLAMKLIRNQLSFTRVGFSVGKKFSKKATDRNKARRILREVFRKELKSIKPGFDIVIIHNKTDRAPDLKDVSNNARRLLVRANCLEIKNQK